MVMINIAAMPINVKILKIHLLQNKVRFEAESWNIALGKQDHSVVATYHCTLLHRIQLLVINEKCMQFAEMELQSTLVISNFTGPDKNVRVISSSRQPNCDVIGMTTVRLSVRQNVLGRHMYMAI